MKLKYELMVILKPLLPEDIRTGVLKKMEGIITKHNGKVISQDSWGKKHLAYPINKHKEGYYIVYKLELEGKQIKEIQTNIKLMNDILRVLLIKED